MSTQPKHNLAKDDISLLRQTPRDSSFSDFAARVQRLGECLANSEDPQTMQVLYYAGSTEQNTLYCAYRLVRTVRWPAPNMHMKWKFQLPRKAKRWMRRLTSI